ncbi:hypothetical protein FUA23_00095 [Neolewinella aurantiaca]|uniref:Uncharacterized protein n=1 Tax=Neolewinella aurantiaca TaxID=2602767 RepID=A0A5C7FLN8_9BACT|nr:hypothetical protein [Neolewinella aurantiaca]TXF91620.1 hypothetical protein FUA23_00095 [Neolewinella aurantiaca]
MNRLLFVFLLTFPLLITAQSYDASLGLRLGTEIGATAQLRLPVVHKNFVAEGIIHQSLRRNEGSFTLLGKQHQNILSRRLNIFYGAGMHLGWTDEINTKTGEVYGRPFGIDGVLGAEATFAKINVSYDFKPAINFGGDAFPVSIQTAISVRYVIAKRNDIWDKKKERANNKERNQNRREREREKKRKQRIKEGKDPNGWKFWKKDGK